MKALKDEPTFMTKEDKQLLIKDLCSRIPYGGVKGSIYDMIVTINSISTNGLISILECPNTTMYEVQEFKPYLFPMSSMIEEQRNEIKNLLNADYYINDYGNLAMIYETYYMDLEEMIVYFNWLNAHHFDYRNLIEKNLGLDVTGLNIYD